MNRNIAKAIQEGETIEEKRKQLSLSAADLDYFFKKFKDDAQNGNIAGAVFNLISDAYLAGLAVGNRNK